MENNKDIDKELWFDGNPQHAARLPTVQKISSEQNLKHRLELKDKDIDEITQYWLISCTLVHTYLRYLECSLKIVMFTERPQQFLSEKHAINRDCNGMDILTYLNATYKYVENGKHFPNDITIILQCIAHLLYRVPKTFKKHYSHLLNIKKF